MNTLSINPAELVGQMVANHLQCDSFSVPEIEELLILLRRASNDGTYEALGRHCAKALLAQLRAQVLARKHIEIARVK